MADAAYCSECRGYVWVDAAGSCSNGHPRSCLRDVHAAAELPTPIGVSPIQSPAGAAQPVAAAGAAASLGTPPYSDAPSTTPGQPDQGIPPASDGYPTQGVPPVDSGFVSQGDPLSAPQADPHGYYMPPREPVNATNTRNIGVRVIAYIIDFVIVLAIQTVIGGGIGLMVGFAAAMGGADPATAGTGLGFNLGLWVVGFSITVGYFTILEATLGFTAGKRIFGLRVVNENAEPITWGQSLGRNLLRFVDLLFWGLVGIISMNSSDFHQRVGDRAANTYVIR